MLKRLFRALGAIVAIVVAVLALGLTWAHVAIRRERAPLPAIDQIVAAGRSASGLAGGLPIRLALINTASQAMPRSAVLDPKKDPHPQTPYVMSHPSFVLEWADGRILLIDAGMTREGALSFGRPLELLGGAETIQPHSSVADRLGEARRRVRGLIFTHLHTDHVGGAPDLCPGLDHRVPVLMTEAQAERPNYTTRSGLGLVRGTSCLEQRRLTGGPLYQVPEFPGVGVIAAGGHTPGSQIIVAHVETAGSVQGYVFTGDIVNHIDGVAHDVPKPFLYRLLMVPEDDRRQGELRRFLRALQDRAGFHLLVSHDQLDPEKSGLPAWQG